MVTSICCCINSHYLWPLAMLAGVDQCCSPVIFGEITLNTPEIGVYRCTVIRTRVGDTARKKENNTIILKTESSRVVS